MCLNLLIVGLDGFNLRLLEHMCSKEYMSIFYELMADGATLGAVASRVGSQSVPHTGPVWTTIYMGLTEREHGVTQGDWLLSDVSLEPQFEQAVFHNLSRSGYDVGSFTIPTTYPTTVENSNL
jgi:predicted AlkP superfamily phosphohydrolase/phosphomutase